MIWFCDILTCSGETVSYDMSEHNNFKMDLSVSKHASGEQCRRGRCAYTKPPPLVSLIDSSTCRHGTYTL